MSTDETKTGEASMPDDQSQSTSAATEAATEAAPVTANDATTSASPATAAATTATTPSPSMQSAPDEQSSSASGEQELLSPEQESPSPEQVVSGNGSSHVGGDMNDDDEETRASGDVDFGVLLDQFEQEQAAYHEGEVVRGRVLGITERGILMDFGFKSEGVVPHEEYAEGDAETLKKDDEVEVIIKSMDSPEGFPVLSRREAMRLRAWDTLEQAHRDNTTIRGRVVERVKGGLRVDIQGIPAFLPGSQIDSRPIRNLDAFRNQEIEARVIKLNRKRANVVLSRKAVLEEQNEGRRSETLSNLEEGFIIEGQIKNLTDYGAFVELGGVDGLLHVTDMSWGRLQHPAEVFKVNDHVQVKVLKLDRGRGRVSLGYKQLLPDPWESVEERYPIGSRIEGAVSSVADYGAFIELEPGVEGLVHVSEMSWSKRMKHPGKLINPGDRAEVEVLGIDTKARRISLGMKQIQANPWETIPQRYQVGSRVTGRVRNLTDFGAFVEVEDGVDGLVHVSDISWNKRIKHPAEALKKGQEIEAVITNIDTGNRRLSLSIKDVEPSAWEKFTSEHKPGDIVRGRVSRFANFGVFVELAEGLEGLCHVSELADERVEKPEDVVQLGQEMEFKILRIEPDSKKIGLTARASAREEQTVETATRSYTTERGGGMASLAELADFGSAASGGGGGDDRER